MKKVKLLLAAFSILISGISCENVGLFGQGGVKGSKAKEEILSIALQNNVIIAAVYGQSTSGVVLSVIIDGVFVPGLAGISDSEHYSRPSVNDCKNKIAGVGILLGNWIGSITCNLNKTPALLQLGDGDNGEVIQIGPLGL